MIPVRVGFRPTSATVTSEPASAEAATSQNAADEISPGTVSVRPTSRWPPASDTTINARDGRTEQSQRPLRMVSRLTGSWTRVTPSACRPASRTEL